MGIFGKITRKYPCAEQTHARLSPLTKIAEGNNVTYAKMRFRRDFGTLCGAIHRLDLKRHSMSKYFSPI